MKSEKLTIAVGQMTSIDDVDANIMQIQTLIDAIDPAAGVRALFLPENALYLRLIEGTAVKGLYLDDPHFQVLAQHARDRKIHIHIGATPLRIDQHLYNSSIMISDDGVITPTYQKMHLFDIQLENHAPNRESDVFRHGQAPKILEIEGWKFGETICYDVRFAELYSLYARREVDVILVPAAFLVKTGEAHWEILLRARAIESQAYVIAAAQSGTHRALQGGGVRETYGHSMVVHPWGQILSENKDRTPGVRVVELHRSEIEKVRRQIPMKDHRRIPLGS